MKKTIQAIREFLRDTIRTDGLLHIETSALLTVFLAGFMPLAGAAVLTLIVGIIKEGADMHRAGDNPDAGHDIACDVFGIALGCCLLIPWLDLATWA